MEHTDHCKNCGACDKCERCDHCGCCRKCGKYVALPYFYPWAVYPYYPRPVFQPAIWPQWTYYQGNIYGSVSSQSYQGNVQNFQTFQLNQ